MIIPVFIPPHEPDRCPSCGKLENVKSVCKHCNYEYKEDDKPSKLGAVLGVLAVVSVILGVLFISPSVALYGHPEFIDYLMGGVLGFAVYFFSGLAVAGLGYLAIYTYEAFKKK